MNTSHADERESDSGAPEDSTLAEKAAEKVKALVTSVVMDGVGPLTGSRAYAEARLSQLQRDRYVAGTDGIREYREADEADIEKVIDRLIGESTGAAGVSGFVTSLGGLITLPITLPANLAGALVINARLAGAIAYLRGWDVEDPHTQTVIMVVALGTSVQNAMKTLGLKVGEKAAAAALRKLPIAVLRDINKRVGFMLLAKYGGKRAVLTLSRMIPVISGFIGGAVDAAMTNLVGRTAKKLFERVS